MLGLYLYYISNRLKKKSIGTQKGPQKLEQILLGITVALLFLFILFFFYDDDDWLLYKQVPEHFVQNCFSAQGLQPDLTIKGSFKNPAFQSRY